MPPSGKFPSNPKPYTHSKHLKTQLRDFTDFSIVVPYSRACALIACYGARVTAHLSVPIFLHWGSYLGITSGLQSKINSMFNIFDKACFFLGSLQLSTLLSRDKVPHITTQ